MTRLTGLAVMCLLLLTAPLHAQWFELDDPDSGVTCGIINTASNTRLVISEEDSSLILINGEDVSLTNTIVDANADVYINDVLTGHISFADDANGRRRVFWVNDLNMLYTLEATGEAI